MVASRSELQSRPSMTPTNRPVRFFKVICQCTISSQKLRFPRMFVRNYGDELSDKINLILPIGQIWKLGITKEKQDIWIDSGWHEFVEHYSIHFKYVLVFEYKGMSNFKVHIFDRSTCAIDCSIIKKAKEEKEGREGNLGATTEKEEDIFTTSQFRKRLKMMSTECQTAAAAASSLKPRNPSFMGIMIPRYVRHRIMYVPAEFARRHIFKSTKNVRIYIGDGRQWMASVQFIGGGANIQGRGWLSFCHENQLKVGDVCIFELITKQNLSLKATIFHVA